MEIQNSVQVLKNILTIHKNVFGDFLKISEDSSKFVQRSDKRSEHFSDNFQR